MKTSIRVTIVSLIMTFSLLSSVVNAAEYYVVIGAFSHEANARRFVGTVRNFFREVSYSFNEERNLYYVHVMRTPRQAEARNWSLYLRHEKGFKGAWVLAQPDAYSSNSADERGHTRGHENRLAFEPGASGVGSSVIPESNATDGSTSASGVSKVDGMWTFSHGFAFIDKVKNIEDFKGSSEETSARLFTFIVEDNKGNVIPSEVMLVNFEKLKKIATFQTGENVAIKGTERNQMVTFVCDLLGYSQETRMFNMAHLSRGRDVRKNEEGIWEVRIKLKKMEASDIAIMNKTLFYKDAAILEPSSQTQMDELVVLMKNNPGYKIILHSHCNPGTARSLKVPATEENYFDLENTIEKGGSDKLLTKKRAGLVKNYLVEHGIDKKRINVVAWGSMEMIVESTSEDAYINERIELELELR